MIWFNFGRWSSSSGPMFKWTRVYRNGYQWTPIIYAQPRYGLNKSLNDLPPDETVK